MADRLRWAIVSLVAVVWAASMVVSWFDDEYDPPAEIHGVLMGIAGIALASTGRRGDGE